MIQVVDNFNYRGKKPNFDRDSFDTLQDMKNYSENSLDDGHISYCKETDKHYKFNSNNQSDPTTGKWVEQHEAVPADEEDITEQNGTLQLANKDELNELTGLVRTLQGNVQTLDTSVGELDTLVERINHLATLKDVTITYITEGDLLQYASDGTWHNIQPSALGIGGGEGGGVVDTSVVKALIKSEGSKLFISKLYDDVSSGIITFNGGLRSNKMTYLNQGVQMGTFVTGMIGGTGAQIDKDGRGEMTSLILREFLEVPELRFNKIDVVSGELWNSIAFGTIEDVDLVNQIVTLKLEEGEYSGIHVNDICRGIFHNFDGVNNTETGTDDCGFDKVQGFTTSYFTPIEVLDARGKQFRYSLKQGTTQHPCKSMKFAVYGNFTDETRQDSAYSTRQYKRYLKKVNTWHINPSKNIASQFGLLDGLNIPGAPNDGNLTGNGAYISNIYLTDAYVQFTPEQIEDLHGQDAYSVSLTRTEGSIIVDNEFNIITDYQQQEQFTFEVQAWRGKTPLTYNTVVDRDTFFCTWESNGIECRVDNGKFTITKITNIHDMKLLVYVHCEGIAIFNKEFNLSYQLEGNSLWVTYNDNDATPDRPVGDGTSYGWHRNYTASAIWMSTKSARKVDDPDVQWGDPNRFRGASVAGKDGQYTVFCYTNSSIKPPKPTGSQIPPADDNYTWYMYPPTRESKEVFTWMIQATVYADKSLSGWTDPIRLTGETGEDGSDGTKLEFIYKVTSASDAPDKPDTSQQDDYIPFGWSDSPQGVSKDMMYEWVSQREKKAAKIGEGVWGEFSEPVLWSKWGEKGMDGDGYEYIFTRTADVDRVPQTPSSIQQNDYIPTISNGGSKDYNWSDDPKGVNEDYKAEWTCKRVRTDGVWSNFSTPALWSNWGEQGLSGGHYQYRWKISATKPSIPTDAAASGWSTNSELVPGDGEYVWQIQRFANPDGTLTAWSNLIRLTGADGEDGKDGNSIEFIYTRNADGSQPSTPASVNQAGHIPSGWTNHPSGVTASLMYEWVSQRYLDKSTQKWGNWSTPGIWSRYSERGKDGDGYEYIYRRFSNYVGGTSLAPGGQYYPPANVDSSEYQQDDYVPDGWTDNPTGPTDAIKYEYVWTRKKENSKWQAWKTGALWSKWGDKGDQGDPGQDGADGSDGADGYSITMSGAPASIRSSLGYLQTTSCTLRAIKTNSSGVTSQAYGYFAVYRYSGSSWNKVSSSSSNQSSYTASWASDTYATKFWFGFCTDTTPSPDSQWTVISYEAPVVYDGTNGSDADSSYTIMRDCGYWKTGVTYYKAAATTAMNSSEYTKYENYQNMTVIDYVQYAGNTYLAKSTNTNQTPSSSSSYWQQASKNTTLTVNNLLANNAKLGEFSFSNNVFTSSNGKLSMNSSTGKLTCTDAVITGEVNATSGKFKNLYFENCFTKNRFLNITHLNRSSSDIDDPKYGDTYCSNSRLYSYQSGGWEDALELYTSSTNAISVYANPSYSKIIHMTGAKEGYTNKLILPSVSEDNYGTEMTIVCRQYPSIRAITGTEGDLHIVTYDSRGSTYTDERTLVLAKGNNGGILNVVSTPQGWLITNCSHDGCSDSGIILKFKVQYNGSSYAVVSSSIHSIYNFNNSKISCTRSGAGAVGVTITSGTSYFWTPCDIRVYGSYRTEGVTGSNAHPIYATLISYSTGVAALNISVQLADDDTLNDGNFYVDIYGGFAQYIGNKPT